MLRDDFGSEVGQSTDGSDRPAPPYIECGRCGSENHYDHALPEEGMPGICPDCSAFLRQPTDEEHRQFTEFLKRNTEKMEGSA